MTSASRISSSFFGGFRASFTHLVSPQAVGEVFARMGPRGGGAPKLSPFEWLMALTHHALAGAGTFASHVRRITGVRISDAALSMRKASYGWELLATLLPKVLRPLADPALHPGSFHGSLHGPLRLLALDGTRFNLRNTPALNAAARPPATGKTGRPAAFAQMLCSVLIELGTHCPLAVSLGWQGEGELTLARDIFDSLTPRSLLLADRLYGSPWLLWEMAPHLEKLESHYLVRVKSNLKSKPLERLPDGSRLVEIHVKNPHTGSPAGKMKVREIHVSLVVEGDPAPKTLRLWTSLLDAEAHPALTLAKLYALRWEHELFFRELKGGIHGAAQLLHAQTVDAAAHEVMALMLGAALLAGQRVGVADAAGVPALRISLAQVLDQSTALFEVLQAGEGILTPEQKIALTVRILQNLAQTAVIKPRQPRRCQRAERQPAKAWPKMRTPTSMPLAVTLRINEPNP